MKSAIYNVFLTGILSEQLNYRLTVIEDETQVPLAAGSAAEYFLPTIMVMLLVAVLVSAMIYLLQCNRYRMRLQELEPAGSVYNGWKLKRLKEAVSEAEMQKMEDMENIF